LGVNGSGAIGAGIRDREVPRSGREEVLDMGIARCRKLTGASAGVEEMERVPRMRALMGNGEE
jgi:hypothetical protein